MSVSMVRPLAVLGRLVLAASLESIKQLASSKDKDQT
jgi:hypothetical protein